MTKIKDMSIHCRTAFFTAILAAGLTINNTIWLLCGAPMSWIYNVVVNIGVVGICIVSYIWENTFTKYLMLVSISAVCIISNVIFPNNKWSFIIELVVINLILYWKMEKKLIWVILGCDFIGSVIGEYFLWKSWYVVINVTILIIVAVPAIYLNTKDIIEIRIRKQIEKKYADMQNDKLKKMFDLRSEYTELIHQCTEKVTENNKILAKMR